MAGVADSGPGPSRGVLVLACDRMTIRKGVALGGAVIAAIACSRCSTSHSSRSTSPDADASIFTSDSGVPVTVTALDGGITTTLPPLPSLSNVVAVEGDDSATITFDPFDGALDYRVYPLPSDSDITVASDGSVIVKNAIYRCAGNREAAAPNVEDAGNPGSWVTTLVDGDTVGGFLRTMANATVGYVYTQPGPGLVPVYVLGESNPNADNSAYFARWEASRTKMYTTSDSVRTEMLANFARDDGIAFYVPATANGTTTQIYIDQDGVGTIFQSRYYFSDSAEAAVHPNKTAAFLALANQAPGTEPLMRVFYSNKSGWSHDELAVGQERFNRAYYQGDGLPWWSLLWAGLTGPTTLVVEALDTQCPYQGHLSPQAIPSIATTFGTNPLIHEPFVTLADMQAASATTEVFINGQAGPAWPWNGQLPNDGGLEYDATAAQITANTGAGLPLPKAIARSFVQVAPQAHPQMDFLATFPPDAAPETFTTIPCGASNCFAAYRQQSATFDQMFIDVEFQNQTEGLYAYGPVMGELWVTYGDVGADTNGKYRLTALQKPTMNTSSFLHVTMEVDSYSTARRYPQILISDQDVPVQYNLPNGHAYVIQPRGETNEWSAWPVDYQFEICNMRTWDVNNQCPDYDLYHNVGEDGGVLSLLPGDEVGEHASVDHRVTWDVFVSTQLGYLFLDGSPYACVNLPATGGVPAGPVTITWGDVLYHSAVDQDFAFHVRHLQIDTRRHFDNLGFSSGVGAPPWDESRFPCVAPITP
jgi:hypothetical protein